MKYFTADFLQDTRTLSYAGRGFWNDCLLIMHSRNDYKISGSISDISRETSGFPDEVKELIDEVESKGVCDVEKKPNGIITLISRRRLREVKERELNNLRQQRHLNNASITENITEKKHAERSPHMDSGSGSGINSSGSGIGGDSKGEWIPVPLQTPEFKDAWEMWKQDRKERRKPITERAATMQLEKMASWGPGRAIAAIKHSIEGGYQGIFEDRNAPKVFTPGRA